MVLLLSTYELGRQPFGLASPAAWLRRAGIEVLAADLSRDRLSTLPVERAPLVAFYLPMHTATRLAPMTSNESPLTTIAVLSSIPIPRSWG